MYEIYGTRGVVDTKLKGTRAHSFIFLSMIPYSIKGTTSALNFIEHSRYVTGEDVHIVIQFRLDLEIRYALCQVLYSVHENCTRETTSVTIVDLLNEEYSS